MVVRALKLEFWLERELLSQRVEPLWMCWALCCPSSCSLCDVEDPLPGEYVLPVVTGSWKKHFKLQYLHTALLFHSENQRSYKTMFFSKL